MRGTVILPDRKRHPQRSAFISDLHAPRHDEVAVANLCDALMDWRPQTLFLLGDIWDCAETSRHPKTPRDARDFQASIDSGVAVVREIIRACTVKPRVILMYGNHETNAEKFVTNQAGPIAGLRSLQMDELFQLKSLGISEVYRYGHVMRWNGLALLHGRKARGKSGMTGHALLQDHFCSGVSGHVHRLARVDVTKTSGRYFWVENGCLCRMDPDFVEDGLPDWSHGFSVGYQGEDKYEVVPVALQGSGAIGKVHDI